MEGESRDFRIPLSPSQGKGMLQELLQKNQFPVPTYKDFNSSGPAHQRVFTVQLKINSRADGNGQREVVWLGTGTGRTKKEAENDVANKGLQFMQGKLDSGQLHLLHVCMKSMFLYSLPCSIISCTSAALHITGDICLLC